MCNYNKRFVKNINLAGYTKVIWIFSGIAYIFVLAVMARATLQTLGDK